MLQPDATRAILAAQPPMLFRREALTLNQTFNQHQARQTFQRRIPHRPMLIRQTQRPLKQGRTRVLPPPSKRPQVDPRPGRRAELCDPGRAGANEGGVIGASCADGHDDGAQDLGGRLELVDAAVGAVEVEREGSVGDEEAADPIVLGEVDCRPEC